MKTIACLLATTGLLLAQAPPRSSITVVPSEVREVTLYRGQALVGRTLSLPDRVGTMELVVQDLPASIVGSSLFAEAADGIEVRAVTYRERAVGETPREEVRRLQEGVETTQDALATVQARLKALDWRQTSLDRLQAFTAATTQGDLQRGVLDPEALQKLVLFGFEQHEALVEQRGKLQREQRDLQERLSLLVRQLAEVKGRDGRTVREAVLFVERRSKETKEIKLSYLVNDCGWSPSYAARASAGNDDLQLDYNALIYQRTGEDWDGVSLRLSTATPSLSAASPALAPFSVTLGVRRNDRGRPKAEARVQEQLRDITRKQQQAQVRLGNAVALEENFASNWAANEAANDYQAIELTVRGDQLKRALSGVATMEEAISLAYELEDPVSLRSRNDRQMVRILRTQLPAEFSHVAIPVLGPQVYREALVSNASEVDLLAGPVTVYLDGRFVGRAELATVARGETFVLGLGADARMRCVRRLLERKERVQGGNAIVRLKVELRTESFYREAVTVRVMDRLPHTDQSQILKVGLEELSRPISEDERYLRTERPLGLLRWDLEVPPGASGEKASAITYTYTLEYDRNFAIQARKLQEEAKEELQRLNRARGR